MLEWGCVLARGQEQAKQYCYNIQKQHGGIREQRKPLADELSNTAIAAEIIRMWIIPEKYRGLEAYQ